ncbi:MAG TPA: substrate-binding domain-containing protein, partial [Gammaproteobacteria bacterium]|nr:substrate-binding domain-containing protein [Gammaproteobacteria bacterium]
VNRQPGSGTRLAFDQMIKDAGIDPQTIQGFETEEFTHLAVAAMVAGEAADIALGIHAAGARFGLRFKPAFSERYMLAVRREALNMPGIAAVIKLLTSHEFQQRSAAMVGYNCADAGTVSKVETFFAGVGGMVEKRMVKH